MKGAEVKDALETDRPEVIFDAVGIDGHRGIGRSEGATDASVSVSQTAGWHVDIAVGGTRGNTDGCSRRIELRKVPDCMIGRVQEKVGLVLHLT